MSPIFIRPVREQLEHDRLIRHLQLKYKKKFDAAINVGEEQVAPVKIGSATFFPDLVLTEGKKLAGLVEVETGESVNNLEAMAQWVHFSRARVPFHLYVPVPGVDAARRLCDANGVKAAEIWTYRASLDGFDLVRAVYDATTPPPSRPAAARPPAAKPTPQKAKAKPKATSKPAPKGAAKKAKPSKPVKPAKAAKRAAKR